MYRIRYTTAILMIPGVLGVFSVLDVADCVLGTERNVTEAKKKRGEKTRGSASIGSHFVRLSLGVLQGLENVINPPDTSRPPDRRPGERVGRGVILIELPLDHLAQRAGGIDT